MSRNRWGEEAMATQAILAMVASRLPWRRKSRRWTANRDRWKATILAKTKAMLARFLRRSKRRMWIVDYK